jgi:hypothetical protein
MQQAVTDFLHRQLDVLAAGYPAAPTIALISSMFLGLAGFLALRTSFRLVRRMGRAIVTKWRARYALSPLVQTIVDTLQNPNLHKTTTDYVIRIWGPPDKTDDRQLLVQVQPLNYSLSCEVMGSKVSEDSVTLYERKIINRTADRVFRQTKNHAECGCLDKLNTKLVEALKRSESEG